jgi:hypothetical protein
MDGGKGIYVGGTLLSILLSLALYATGKRESAIFVGLWAPTILNLGQSLQEFRKGASQKDAGDEADELRERGELPRDEQASSPAEDARAEEQPKAPSS